MISFFNFIYIYTFYITESWENIKYSWIYRLCVLLVNCDNAYMINNTKHILHGWLYIYSIIFSLYFIKIVVITRFLHNIYSTHDNARLDILFWVIVVWTVWLLISIWRNFTCKVIATEIVNKIVKVILRIIKWSIDVAHHVHIVKYSALDKVSLLLKILQCIYISSFNSSQHIQISQTLKVIHRCIQ